MYKIIMQALINANILCPDGFSPNLSVIVKDGTIIDIIPSIPANIKTIDIKGDFLIPGFIDLQVNGGGGVLFNDNPSVETIKTIAAAHRKFGTTSFFPTLISDSKDKIKQAIKAVDAAIKSKTPGVIGIHLEGPFLNAQKKGVHDEKFFTSITDEDIELVTSLKSGKTIITLAPETSNYKTIKSLVERGVIVSAGHSMASFDQTNKAINAGLSGFTHLYNAMRPIHHREPGLILAALLDNRTWSGIIVDGHHVHPAMLKLALKAKGEDKLFLVTDAMPCVGGGDSFKLGGKTIIVKNGICQTEDGVLAGSALDMMTAVKMAKKMLGIGFEQAVKMATQTPASFIGLDNKIGQIKKGHKANLLQVSKDLQIVKCWIDGVIHQ